MMVASGRAAKMGIFFKDYDALEASGGSTPSCSTRPEPSPKVEWRCSIASSWNVNRSDVLRQAGAVEQASEHLVVERYSTPLSLSWVNSRAVGFVAIPGLGASGVVDGRRVDVGV